MSEEKGFIGSLFDLSFTEFVTTRMIKILFVLAIIGAAGVAVSMIIKGFASDIGTGVVMLVLSPLIFFCYILLARMWLELIIVIFRIAENTGRLVEQGKSDAGSESGL